MPYTKKQQKAACAAYGIKKKGGTPKVMGNMSLKKLRSWCKADKLEKPKNESIGFKAPTLRAVRKRSFFETKLNEALAPVAQGMIGVAKKREPGTVNAYCPNEMCKGTTPHKEVEGGLRCTKCGSLKKSRPKFAHGMMMKNEGVLDTVAKAATGAVQKVTGAVQKVIGPQPSRAERNEAEGYKAGKTDPKKPANGAAETPKDEKKISYTGPTADLGKDIEDDL